MQARIQTISATKYRAMPCGRCGANELQPRPTSLLHKLYGVNRFLCTRCGHRESEYRPTLATVGGFLLFAAMVGAIVFFTTQSTIFRRGEDAAATNDALALARSSAGGLSTFEKMMIKEAADDAEQRDRPASLAGECGNRYHLAVNPDICCGLRRKRQFRH